MTPQGFWWVGGGELGAKNFIPSNLSFCGAGRHSQKCKGSENIPLVEKLFEDTFQWFIGLGLHRPEKNFKNNLETHIGLPTFNFVKTFKTTQTTI